MCSCQPRVLLTLSLGLLLLSSNGAVSNLVPVNVDTVAVGLVSSMVVYPLYLVILFLFRMARGKVMRRSSRRLPRWE